MQERQAGRRSCVFNLIQKNNQQLSRFDICKLTRYSTTTVTAIVDGLVEEGLVIEDASKENRVGRRPSLLCVNPQSIYFLGIECNASDVNLTVIDTMQQVVVHESILLKAPDAAEILHAVDRLLADFIAAHEDLWQKIPSVAFSIPGTLNQETGLAIQYRTVPDWHNIDFQARFSYLGKKLLFINNVDAMLIGYRAQKQLDPAQSVLFLIIRNSAGVRFYSKGQLLSDLDVICEVGHMRAIGSARRCACGRKGCYDAEISTSAVLNKLREAYYAGLISPELLSPEEITIEKFLRLVEQQEPAALDIFSEVTDYTAQMLETLFGFFRPDVAVLSTYLCENSSLLEQALSRRFAQADVEDLPPITCIPPANELSSFGAAIVGYHEAFPLPSSEL